MKFAYLLFAILIELFVLSPACHADTQNNASNEEPIPSLSNSVLEQLGCSANTDDSNYCEIQSVLPLSSAFHLKDHWLFVVPQKNNLDPNSGDLGGDLSFCFVRDGRPMCSNGVKSCNPGLCLNQLVSSSIIYPSVRSRSAVVFASAHFFSGGPGSGRFFNFIWAYNPKLHSFTQIWSDNSYPGRNEETRFFKTGPLAGDIVIAINDPTHRIPYPYGIEVFRFAPPDRYVKILNFIGKSAQMSGPPGPVIDADMPEILKRLGGRN